MEIISMETEMILVAGNQLGQSNSAGCQFNGELHFFRFIFRSFPTKHFLNVALLPTGNKQEK